MRSGAAARAGIMAAALVLVATTPAAGAEDRGVAEPVISRGCQDSTALIPADPAEVRRQMPGVDWSRYRIYGEDLGAAVLVVRVFACDSLQIPGFRPKPTLGAQFAVTIESPDGTGRAFGSDACCNWYLLFWVTDNRRLARWLRDGTGLGGRVRHVRRLAHRYQPGLGSVAGATHFAARKPTPSPFRLEATVLAPFEPWPGVDIAPNWWAETGRGRVKLANDAPAVRFHESDGEVRARAGTRMAALFGAEQRSFGSPFSYGRWDRSTTAKEVTPTGG